MSKNISTPVEGRAPPPRGARKGAKDLLSEAHSRPVTGNIMFDQLAVSNETKPRRFPSCARANPPIPQQEHPVTLQYDVIAPPRQVGGFDRASSSPEEPVWRRQGEPPDLFGRLSSTPARFESSHEEVKVMQQSAGKAWLILGGRFYAAHAHDDDAGPAARTSHTTLAPVRHSSVAHAHPHVPSARQLYRSRRSSIVAGGLQP